MNRYLLLIFAYLFICKNIYSQIITYVDTIDSSYVFTLKNNTKDTVYLFDSYLEELYYHQKYIHRYSRWDKQCKLSFLPMLSLLNGRGIGNTIILGGHKIARYGYVAYSFKPLAPGARMDIIIPYTAFYIKDYVIDYWDITYNTAYFDDVEKFSCKNIVVEFAIYREIGILKTKDAFYRNTVTYYRQAKKYEVLSIPIPISIERSAENDCCQH
ncbi:MAG: hypothetical protein R3Y59_09340 [bacterium]